MSKTQESLIEELDNLKQAQRNKTIRISGLPETDPENVITKVLDLAKTTKKLTMPQTAINSAWRVGGKKNSKSARQVIVKFNDENSKRAFYPKRTTLRTLNSAIFINEDLTARRAEIFAAAWKMVKDKLATNTWTIDGNIFVKMGPLDKPLRMNRINDLKTEVDKIVASQKVNQHGPEPKASPWAAILDYLNASTIY